MTMTMTSFDSLGIESKLNPPDLLGYAMGGAAALTARMLLIGREFYPKDSDSLRLKNQIALTLTLSSGKDSHWLHRLVRGPMMPIKSLAQIAITF